MIDIQIVYALPENPTIIDFQVASGTDVQNAILDSKILETCQINLANHKIGIYGNLIELNHCLKDGDRIEIYRSLINDPKEIRRQRANSSKKVNDR